MRFGRDLWAFAGYARRLPGFLARPVGSGESRDWLEHALEARDANFLHILERVVFPNPRSPYRTLFAHAGIELGDVARLVRDDGLEGALTRLYDAGIHVTQEEFKGRRRLERPGLSLELRAEDFDNQLLGATVGGTTGASRGPGTRVLLDLDLLEHRVAYDWLTAAASDRGERLHHLATAAARWPDRRADTAMFLRRLAILLALRLWRPRTAIGLAARWPLTATPAFLIRTIPMWIRVGEWVTGGLTHRGGEPSPQQTTASTAR